MSTTLIKEIQKSKCAEAPPKPAALPSVAAAAPWCSHSCFPGRPLVQNSVRQSRSNALKPDILEALVHL